jgi:cell wall-associated NlpC family hydrolase
MDIDPELATEEQSGGPPFFNTPDSKARLTAAVAQWKGTPFREGIGQKARPGIGADCASFADRIMANLGAITPAKWPERYATYGGGRQMLGSILEVLNVIPELKIIWRKGDHPKVENQVKVGDVILCSTGYSLHHLAIYMGGNVIVHCLMRGGVQEGNLFDPIVYRNILTVYRPIRL